MLKRNLLVAGVALGTAGAFSHSATASVVTIPFSGQVGEVNDESGQGDIPSAIQPGDPYTGTISFDNSAAPYYTDATDAYYNGSALDLNVSILIDDTYGYTLTSNSSDRVDLEGSTFGFYISDPTVYTSFPPNAPYNAFQFEVNTDVDLLSQTTATDLSYNPDLITAVSDSVGSGGWNILLNAETFSVPEPTAAGLFILLAFPVLLRKRARAGTD